jgi:hypothetical protein
MLNPTYAAARAEVRRLSVGEDGILSVKVKELRGYPETSGPHCIALKPPSDDNEKQD